MRFLLTLLPAIALAQTPQSTAPAAPKPATAPKPAAPAAAPATATAAAPGSLATDDEQAIYAIGVQISSMIKQFNLSPAELEIVKRGITDGAAGKPAGPIDVWGPKINPFGQARMAAASEKTKAAGAAYLAKELTKPGTIKTETGIVYRELVAGTGASPQKSDTVKVHYRGTLIDGTEFDSSYKRNQPATFPLGGVIGCWTEGVQRMKVGGKSILMCPSNLAYGDVGNQSIPGGSTLIFEIELLEIPAPAATPAPAAK
jgi:FKBP-type peptidyl-prolyl cis-trans isomerase FkpA